MAASLLAPLVPCPEMNSSQPAGAVGCQNFSGEKAVLVLLLWRKCHAFLCICPPGVSSLSLATGYFLQHYCCLHSLLLIPTVVSYKMVIGPGIPDHASLFPSPTSCFSPCVCWLLWLWHEFLVSTQEQALLVSVFSWIKYRQVTSDVIMIALHYLQHWAQIRTGMHSCVFNIFCWPVEAGDGEGCGYMTKLLFQNRMVKQDPDKCQTFLYQVCQA